MYTDSIWDAPRRNNKNTYLKRIKSCWLLWGREGMKNVYSLIELTLIIIMLLLCLYSHSFIHWFFHKTNCGISTLILPFLASRKSLITNTPYPIFVFLTANKLSNQCQMFTSCYHKNWNIVEHISFFTTYFSKNK